MIILATCDLRGCQERVQSVNDRNTDDGLCVGGVYVCIGAFCVRKTPHADDFFFFDFLSRMS